MGNCPSGFQVNPAQGFTCVVQCPNEKGFENGISNGMPSCVYRDDKTVFVPLTVVQGIQGPPNQPNIVISLEQLKTSNPAVYNQYKSAQEKFDKDFPIAFAQIDKQKKVTDAFRQLQAAENVRDQSPQAYQDARIRYYTLVKGENWIDEERERVMTAEVAPKIGEYMSSYRDIDTRIRQQQQTLDVVKNVKDKVISMKDEFKYATTTFSKQIDQLKNQINMEKKAREKDNQSWVDFLLNALIVIISIVLVVVLVKKMVMPNKSVYTQSPVYRQ